MTLRSEQKAKRRNEIMNAGLDLFIHRGFAATKISDIAEKSGMSAGLLFHYFKSKEHLYEELIRFGMTGPASALSGEITDAFSFFENTAAQIIEGASREPTVAKMFVLMNQAAFNDAAPASVKEMLKDEDAVRQSVLLISKGQQDGTIRVGNPVALSMTFWAAMKGVCEEMALHPETPVPEIDWIVDIIRRKNE